MLQRKVAAQHKLLGFRAFLKAFKERDCERIEMFWFPRFHALRIPEKRTERQRMSSLPPSYADFIGLARFMPSRTFSWQWSR